ncbi:MAG TPA: hypothetical protein VFX59_23780 [Polyangiales bacterium]|nr:hypothetical protein [Polyangiales bacterium]
MRTAWAVAVMMLLACGRPSETPRELPKPPLDPWAWLPADSTIVGKVALTDLRKTQLWPLWAEVEKEQRIDAWVPLDKVDRLTFGGTGQTVDNLSYVAALEGTFSLLELSALAKQDNTPRERHGILTFYRRPDSLWTQVDESLIIVCTPDRVMQVADRAVAGPGTPVKDAALYKTLADRVALPVAHVALMAEDPEGKGRAMLDQHAEQYGLGQFTQDAKRLGFSVEITADYRIVAVAETTDDERAQALETATREKLGSIANNMFVRMLGLGGMVSRMRVSGDQHFVFVRGAVPEVDFNAAVDRLHRMLSVAKGPAHTSSEE